MTDNLSAILPKMIGYTLTEVTIKWSVDQTIVIFVAAERRSWAVTLAECRGERIEHLYAAWDDLIGVRMDHCLGVKLVAKARPGATS